MNAVQPTGGDPLEAARISLRPGLLSQPLRDAAPVGASRLRILELLRHAPDGLGIADLATQVGLHVNTVRFHLDRLVGEGLVRRDTQPRSEPGRPRLTFTAAPRPDVGRDQRNYQFLAEMLAGYFASAVRDAAAEALVVGQTWGGYLTTRPAPYRRTTAETAVAELLRVLDDLGFVPDLKEDGAGQRILLRHCPFLEVAETHQDIVCSVHLGLMQGVLSELRAPVATDRLLPFAEPAACVAHLSRSSPPPDSSG